MLLKSNPPSINYFQKVMENFGASTLADKLLDGKITDELDQFPPTVRAWLLQFKRRDKERECRPIDGFMGPMGSSLFTSTTVDDWAREILHIGFRKAGKIPFLRRNYTKA